MQGLFNENLAFEKILLFQYHAFFLYKFYSSIIFIQIAVQVCEECIIKMLKSIQTSFLKRNAHFSRRPFNYLISSSKETDFSEWTTAFTQEILPILWFYIKKKT